MYGICCDNPNCKIDSLELHEPVLYTDMRNVPLVPKKLVSRHQHVCDKDGTQIRSTGCTWGNQQLVPA